MVVFVLYYKWVRSEIRVRVRVGGLYLEWVKRENQVLSLDSELNEVMV